MKSKVDKKGGNKKQHSKLIQQKKDKKLNAKNSRLERIKEMKYLLKKQAEADSEKSED